MVAGRPVGSVIRQNVVELLAVLGRAYGYEVHRCYIEVFPPCVRKSVYYHLRKGVVTGEFVVESIATEKGVFSWGSSVEKTYYRLGPNAKPVGDERVRKFFENVVKKS